MLRLHTTLQTPAFAIKEKKRCGGATDPSDLWPSRHRDALLRFAEWWNTHPLCLDVRWNTVKHRGLDDDVVEVAPAG
jgi:hypothetical protein